MAISFHRGACGCCVRVAKWLPVIFITSVVGWSYYAYVYQLCFRTISENDGWFLTIALLFPYHALLGLFVWSYWKTVFTPPGSVPKKFALTVADMDSIEGAVDPRATLEQLAVSKDLPVAMRSIQGEVRYCSECSHVKPDRTHHCSVCGQCVLKMDHHCPWVNNCVAFQNYKYFILFLGYAVLYCLFVALSTLKYFLLYWSSSGQGFQSSKFHILFLFFVSGMFCISVTSLFGYHLYLVTRNQTTLESFRAPIFRPNLVPDKRGFHLGTMNNVQEVFGDTRFLWFFPVDSGLGDGICFPQRSTCSQHDEEMGYLAASTVPTPRSAQSLQNGHMSRNFRTNRYRGHKDIQSNVNRAMVSSENYDELVPMINATTFEDEDSEEDLNWKDANNQSTQYPHSVRYHQQRSDNKLPSSRAPALDTYSSTSSSSDAIENEEVVFRSEKDKPAVINIEHDEKHSDFMLDSDLKCDVGEVSIRSSPMSTGSSRDGRNKSSKNKSSTLDTPAVEL